MQDLQDAQSDALSRDARIGSNVSVRQRTQRKSISTRSVNAGKRYTESAARIGSSWNGRL